MVTPETAVDVDRGYSILKVLAMRNLLGKTKKISMILMLVFTSILALSSCATGLTASNNQTQPAGVTTSIPRRPAANSSDPDPDRTEHTSGTSSETEFISPTTSELILLPPVESDLPNSGYEPAFTDQTRAPGTSTQTPYAVAVLTEELHSPWAVAALPDNRLVITEKAGTMRIWTEEDQLSLPIGGFPDVDSRGQGGLLDVAPAPDFLSSRMLYFTLAESTDQGSLTAVGRGRLAADESLIEDFEIIWRALPYYDNSKHFGSRLVFDQNGNIFATTGERSDFETRPMAQFLDNGYGKVVHITPDGNPAPGSPFVDREGAWPEIYSYGHRNVQGLAIQPTTGELWISEMGPRGGDELNLIQAGKNYGWPEISYGIEYSGAPVNEALTAKAGMEQPVYYWDPSLAPGGMTFYTADAIKEWQGNLFIGALVSRHIARLVIRDGLVIAEERLLADEGQRFRDLSEGPGGALYAITDSGRLYRIS